MALREVGVWDGEESPCSWWSVLCVLVHSKRYNGLHENATRMKAFVVISLAISKEVFLGLFLASSKVSRVASLMMVLTFQWLPVWLPLRWVSMPFKLPRGLLWWFSLMFLKSFLLSLRNYYFFVNLLFHLNPALSIGALRAIVGLELWHWFRVSVLIGNLPVYQILVSYLVACIF